MLAVPNNRSVINIDEIHKKAWIIFWRFATFPTSIVDVEVRLISRARLYSLYKIVKLETTSRTDLKTNEQDKNDPFIWRLVTVNIRRPFSEFFWREWGSVHRLLDTQPLTKFVPKTNNAAGAYRTIARSPHLFQIYCAACVVTQGKSNNLKLETISGV